ncbi:DUF1858 domain-containing protein [bacterium]|nr:DUF1858 domain-containing protein [bacterium]
MLIEPNMPVEILLDKYPESHVWLLEKRLHCTQCGEPVWGTIEELIVSKGMDPQAILTELNEFLEKQNPIV